MWGLDDIHLVSSNKVIIKKIQGLMMDEMFYFSLWNHFFKGTQHRKNKYLFVGKQILFATFYMSRKTTIENGISSLQA